MNIGIVSGYFNPLHQGHLEYIEAAKSKCAYLICIVNNDSQVALKGSRKFMNQDHRCRIMQSLRAVDEVVLSLDTDRTVCKTLYAINTRMTDRDITFFNSGDRIDDNVESSEVVLCKTIGLKYVAIPLPKRYSSSKLLENL